jgi:hypothetical protein
MLANKITKNQLTTTTEGKPRVVLSFELEKQK